MNNLTKPKTPFKRSPDCEMSFNGLKDAITTAPVLKAPDFDKPFTVISDASGFGMGGVLVQDGRPIAYNSKKFTPAEKNYGVTEQELRAVVYNLEVWRPYLEGAEKVIIITDHNPNTFFQDKQVLSRRQVRWYEFLSRFHLEWKYEPGRTNVADPLSRSPALLQAMNDSIQITAVTTRARATGFSRPAPPTRGDSSLPQGSVVEGAVSTHTGDPALPQGTQSTHTGGQVPPQGTHPDVPARAATHTSKKQKVAARPRDAVFDPVRIPAGPSITNDFVSRLRASYAADSFYANSDNVTNMVQHDGIWYIQRGESLVISVPHDLALRTLIISNYHSPPCRGHGGLTKTKDLIERHFHWQGLYTQVKKYIETCEFCQRNKSSNQAPAGPLQPIAPPANPFDTITMDLIVDLPVDKSTGYDSIMVVVDKLTKMAKFLPCNKTVTSTDIAQKLYSQVFALYGKPAQLITDRDPRFTGNFFREWCRGLNVKQCLTTAYHPQSDGQTERMNRILEDYLRNYVNPQGDDWVKYLPSAEFAINNAYQESIRASPFFLNFGRNPTAVEG